MSKKTKEEIAGAGNIHQLKAKRKNTDSTPLTMQEIALPLIAIRHKIRKTVKTLNTARDEAYQYGRKARQLKGYNSPFYAGRIAELEQTASAIHKGMESTNAALKAWGYLLMDISHMLDTCTTLAQRCELVNVNVSDRGDLTESDSLAHIIFVHGLEDSAEHRGKDFKEGAMFEALQLVFMDFLTNTEEGQAVGDSLFEEGGLFESIPTYKQDKEGNMQRQPPALKLIKPTYH
ncbi:hypothetical protein ACO0K2_15750 [Undibacterium sp. MH2W]|uniref:hypothetical protein n=1 Tax=Undibacterium sp. MH2W TaxID=3413044 RepID=UPI003BF07A38